MLYSMYFRITGQYPKQCLCYQLATFVVPGQYNPVCESPLEALVSALRTVENSTPSVPVSIHMK